MKEVYYYFDSSALVKRYVEEKGSNDIDGFWARASRVFTASLSYAEIYSAFYRLFRDGSVSKKNLSILIGEFETDWKSLVIIEFGEDIRRKVPQVIAKSVLRGADLVHMACMVYVRERQIPIEMVTFDLRMRHCADDIGIPIAAV